MTELPVLNRSCGNCYECCVQIAVEPLGKPADEPCPHLAAGPNGACSVYADRPQCCKQFTCAWLDGYLPESMKPSESGIVLEAGEIRWPKVLKLLSGFATAEQIERYAADLSDAATGGVLIGLACSDSEGAAWFGDPADLEALATWLEQCEAEGGITSVYADGETREITL